MNRRTLPGIGVSPGFAGGPVARLGRPPVLPTVRPTAREAHIEIDRALSALESVAADLDARAAQCTLPDAAAVLGATAMIARDSMLAETLTAKVGHGLPAAWAVDAAIAEHRDVLVRIGGYIGERASDLDDVRDRAVALLLGEPMPGVPDLPHPYVLVADDLAPADTATLVPGRVVDVTMRGGPTSHTAILARALGLPAIVACTAASELRDGQLVILRRLARVALMRERLGECGEEPAVWFLSGLFAFGEKVAAGFGHFGGGGGGAVEFAGGSKRKGEVDAGIIGFMKRESVAVKFARLFQCLGGGGGIVRAPPHFLVHAAEQAERLLIVVRLHHEFAEDFARAVERAGLRQREGELLFQFQSAAEAAQRIAGDLDGREHLPGGDGLLHRTLELLHFLEQRRARAFGVIVLGNVGAHC